MKIKESTFITISVCLFFVIMMFAASTKWHIFTMLAVWLVFSLLFKVGLRFVVENIQQVQFNDVARWGSKYSELPQGFAAAWEWVENNLAKESICYTAGEPCDICGRYGSDNYKSEYVYNKYKWTGMERHHKMWVHVECGCNQHGYWLPEPVFVEMIMRAYEVHCIEGAEKA